MACSACQAGLARRTRPPCEHRGPPRTSRLARCLTVEPLNAFDWPATEIDACRDRRVNQPAFGGVEPVCNTRSSFRGNCRSHHPLPAHPRAGLVFLCFCSPASLGQCAWSPIDSVWIWVFLAGARVDTWSARGNPVHLADSLLPSPKPCKPGGSFVLADCRYAQNTEYIHSTYGWWLAGDGRE